MTKILSGLFSLFDSIDGAIPGASHPLAHIAVWALVCGCISMALYRLLSPQARIEAAGVAATRTRQALVSYDGPADGLGPLAGAAIFTALRHMALCLLPTLVSALPVIAVFYWMHSTYNDVPAQPGVVREYISWGPVWLRAWYTPFCAVMFVVSFGIKLVFKIK